MTGRFTQQCIPMIFRYAEARFISSYFIRVSNSDDIKILRSTCPKNTILPRMFRCFKEREWICFIYFFSNTDELHIVTRLTNCFAQYELYLIFLYFNHLVTSVKLAMTNKNIISLPILFPFELILKERDIFFVLLIDMLRGIP